MAAAEVEDLAIRLSGETAPFQTSMERAAAAGDAAANAAVRAAESTTALSDSAVRASTGINRVADMQLKANATYKEATVFQRELSAAVATTNRANAEQVAMLHATADAAMREASALVAATDAEKLARAAALDNAEALKIQATAASQAAAAASRDGAAQMQAAKASTVAAEERSAAGAKIATGMKVAAAGIAILAAVSLHVAGNFQKDTNVLVTAAGESQGALAGIRKGILEISTGTGTGLHELTDGMYMVEKAGYRGAEGLKVLKAAAQGAREENASLAAVTNAMTSVMASYHLGASQSVPVMNALKTAAGESKTTMENYATALSTVIPIASANKIGFDQVAGAIATLTQHGTSAAEATQELSSTIRSLAAPNMVAQKEMAQLGLQANDVSQNLGKRGLTGTVDLLVNAITSHMGHAGTVLMSAFNQSKSAAADANVMIAAMPSNVAKLAKEFADGSITMGAWRKAIKDLPADQASMATQFAALEGRSRGFNDLLKSGSPAAQTFTDALKRMSGGAIGLNTILQLSGENSAGFKTRVEAVSKSLHDGGKDVEGWASTQKLFNVQVDRAKQSTVAFAVGLGTDLLPAASKVMGVLASGVTVLTKHKTAVEAVGGTLLAVGGMMLAYRVGVLAATAAEAVMTTATALLNGTLALNPVGLVVAALVALAVGFTIAWKKSETFRDVVMTAFHGMMTGVYAFAYGAATYVRYFLDVWLNVVSGTLKAAAGFLGWVPGIGPKLKAASAAFDGMKDDIIGTVTKLQTSMHDKMQKAATDTAVQAALLGIAISKPLKDRLPAYESIASRYGMTLSSVLDRAKLPTGDKAKLLAMETAKQVSQASPYMKQVSDRLAALPRAALLDTDTRTSATAAAVGKGIADGLLSGMRSSMAKIIKQAQTMGAAAVGAARQGAQVFSPSKATIYVGEMLGEGLIVGMGSKLRGVVAAAKALAQAATGAAAGAGTVNLADLKAAQARANQTPIDKARLDDLNSAAAVDAARKKSAAANQAAAKSYDTYATAAHKAQAADATLRAAQAAQRSGANAALDHARALRAAADAASMHAKAMPAVTLAQQAAKKAAEAHASALAYQAREAGRAATTLREHGAAGVASAKAAASAADAAAKKAKDAYLSAKTNAGDAAKALTGALTQASQAHAALADAVYADTLAKAQTFTSDISSQLDVLVTKANDMRSSFSSAALNQSSLADLFTPAGGGTGIGTAADAITALQGRLTAAKDLATQMQQLQAAGLSDTLVKQISDAGTATGSQIAQAILAGGPEAVASLNDLSTQLATVASSGLDQVVSGFYGQGAAALQQLAEGMRAGFPELDAVLAEIAGKVSSVYGTAPVPSVAGTSAIPAPSAGGTTTVIVHPQPITLTLDGRTVSEATASYDRDQLRQYAREQNIPAPI